MVLAEEQCKLSLTLSARIHIHIIFPPCRKWRRHTFHRHVFIQETISVTIIPWGDADFARWDFAYIAKECPILVRMHTL
jgi:hypothetical protein